jgi:hypothetical protein
MQIWLLPLLTQATDLMLVLETFKLKQIINVSKDTHTHTVHFLNISTDIKVDSGRMLHIKNTPFIISLEEMMHLVQNVNVSSLLFALWKILY